MLDRQFFMLKRGCLYLSFSLVMFLIGCSANPFASAPPVKPTESRQTITLSSATKEPESKANLIFQVQVKDSVTAQNVSDAKVMLMAQDESTESLSSVTDTTGNAILSLPDSRSGDVALIAVEASGYERFTLNVVLEAGGRKEILLVPEGGTAPPEPTNEPTEAPAIEAIETNATQSDTSAPEDRLALPKTAEEALSEFKEQGYFTAAVREDAPPFGLKVNGGLEGFDIDVVQEFAKRWLGDASKVQLIPVPAARRIEVLVNREVNLTAAAMTHTEERCEQVGCTQTYALDGARLLVRADSGINNICELDGQFVSVLKGTSAKQNIEELAPRWCEYQKLPQVLEYEQRAEAIQAVEAGVVAAYTTDGLILEQYANEDLTVVGDEFRPEPYHMAVPKGDKGVVELINLTLQEMKADGTYDALHETWLGCRNAPFPILIDDSVTRPDFVKSDGPLQPTLCSERADINRATTYEMQSGDTLAGVALRHYGSYNMYVCLQHANGISDDDLRRIPIGQLLELPPITECENK